MTGAQYTFLAYAISLGLMFVYGTLQWVESRNLARRRGRGEET